MKGIGPVGPAGRTVAVNPLMLLMCLAFALALPARADSDPNACRGIDFDVKRPLVASRISVHKGFGR
jgi:hypothetical protein